MFTCGSHYAAKNSPTDGYVYNFTHLSSFNLILSYISGVPFCENSVCHGFDLPYVFHPNLCYIDYYGNYNCTSTSFTPEEEQLSQDIMHYNANFARHLDPNNGGLNWPLFQSGNDYMELDVPLAVKNSTEACSLSDSIGYDLAKYFWPNLIKAMKKNVKNHSTTTR
jgi:carboxylesterase type B